MNKNKEEYVIVFNYQRETNKAIMVRKKTKKMDRTIWIPKSVITNIHSYNVERNLWKDVKYTMNRIELTIKAWYVEKELKFYR